MRIRLTYSKTGNLIYTSVLDVQKIWERSFRRAKLPLKYSQGFHPQPRIQISNPLPVGFTGRNELVDIWLIDDLALDQIINCLKGKLPEGMTINKIDLVDDRSPALVNLVIFSDYIIRFYDELPTSETVGKEIDMLLEKESIPRVRNRKSYDLRPLIQSVTIREDENSKVIVSMRMNSSPGKTGRPEEVFFELGYQLSDFMIERTNLILSEA